MREKRYLKRLTLIILALMAGAIGNFLFAQAYTVPVSEKTVKWKITLPDENWVKGRVLEGGMTRIEKKGELIFGFSPIIRDEKEKRIEVMVFKIERRADGKETIKEVETLEVTGNIRVFTNTAPIFGIEVLEIGKIQKEKLQEVSPLLSRGRCCVTCGEWTACCCAVEMSCGECCTNPCCEH